MDPRRFWEKYSRKWTAYVVVAFLLFTVVIHIFHLLGSKLFPNLNEQVLSETLGAASFFLIFLLLEEVFAGREKMEAASEESRRQQDLTSSKLDELSTQVESTSGIAAYSELSAFRDKWQKLRDNFAVVTLVGNLPIDYCKETRSLCEEDKKSGSAVPEKEFSIYRSLNRSSKKEINDLPDAISQARPELVKVYHMYGFEWGSWAMGRNDRGDETEVLLNYASPRGDALAGLHLVGKAAESFAKSATPDLGIGGMPGVAYAPVRLASREQVEFIIEEKAQYQKMIKEMVEMGVPFEGIPSICGAMSKLLRDTRKVLDVTHLCWNEAGIASLQDPDFVRWLETNYGAASRVTIRRIFIVRRQHYNHKILQQVIQEMRSKKIEVLLCPLDALQERYREDFSLYDDQHVVYMDKARSVFGYGEQVPVARQTENPQKIQEYRDIFDLLIERYVEVSQ